MSYAKSFSMMKLVNGDISDEQRKLAIAIDTGVVISTPVDTGRARLNWIVTNDKPTEKTLEAPGDSGMVMGQSLSAANTEIRKIKPYSLTYIQNNLPYIDRLNMGWSSQAPAYYVERVINRAVNS